MNENDFISGSEPDACEKWAAIIYNNLKVRQKLINKLGIIFLTTGEIMYDTENAVSLIHFMANKSSDIEWEPDATEEQKLQVAGEVVAHLFDMFVDGNKYLARFSVN